MNIMSLHLAWFRQTASEEIYIGSPSIVQKLISTFAQ